MHLPVLQKEVIQFLDPKPNENFIDATFGEGGHTAAILKRNKPEGRVLGIEIDPELYQKLKSKIPNRLILVNDSYLNLKEIVKKYKFQAIKGILFDLGLSSWHLEESGRGFSFQRDEPLIMRYDGKKGISAKEIINQWSEKEIEKILKEYGEERFAKRIAKAIIEARKICRIETTFQLVEIIKKAVPIWYQQRKRPRRSRFATLRGRHPATKTFQALRIAVNDELNNLKMALPQALEVLERGGRLVVISFHSLEDRIVKDFFRENLLRLKILTKKPISPSKEEIRKNPRSRSAKLRAAIKL